MIQEEEVNNSHYLQLNKYQAIYNLSKIMEFKMPEINCKINK